MSFRHLTKRASPSHISRIVQQTRHATVAPPVTQNSVGKNGPTAMVFLNMGGPSTTDEVGDFLSRLFVRSTYPIRIHILQKLTLYLHRPTATLSRLVGCKATSARSSRSVAR